MEHTTTIAHYIKENFLDRDFFFLDILNLLKAFSFNIGCFSFDTEFDLPWDARSLLCLSFPALFYTLLILNQKDKEQLGIWCTMYTGILFTPGI